MQLTLPLNQMILIVLCYLAAIVTKGMYFILELVFSFEINEL